MTRKPNFAKFILSLTVLALLFIGTLASSGTTRTNAALGKLAAGLAFGPLQKGTPPPPPVVPPEIANVFEIDGDAFDQAGGTFPPEDWDLLNPEDSTATNVVPAGSKAEVFSFVPDNLADDQIFTQGGSKDFNDINQWRHSTGAVPDKDQIQHAYAARYTDPESGDKILVFGGDRDATNGDANIGFWFFQNAVAPVEGGTFTGAHTLGDVFVLSAFTGGGGTSTIQVYVWVGTNADGTPATPAQAAALCAAAPYEGTVDPSGNSLCLLPGTSAAGAGIVNNKDLNGGTGNPPQVDWLYTAKGDKTPCTTAPCDVPKGAFYEGGINLTALDLDQQCFASFMLETRSSASVDAVLKDYALGNFENCECTVSPASQETCAGIPVQFCAVDPDGLVGPFTYSWTGPGGFTSTDMCISVSTAGSYEVTITDGASGIETVCDGELTVLTAPTAVVSGGGEYCVGSGGSATIQAALTGTGPWSVTWSDGVIQNNVLTSPASRTVSPAATTVYTVTAVSDANCAGTASGSATVTVNPNPTVTINSIVGCKLDGSPTVTLTATPAGGTGTKTCQWSGGSTSTSCTIEVGAGSYTVTVTDGKSCPATATRNIGLCSD